ncbi:MAG: protein-disulfide reductase DsbD, partial [Pseudomonadota bacterium]
MSFSNVIKKLFVTSFVILLALSFFQKGIAQETPESLFADSPTFLKVEEAFVLNHEQKGEQLIIKWDIAEGYYLYKKQFKTSLTDVELGEPSFPPAVEIEDEFFGISEVFLEDMEIVYPIIGAKQDGSVALRYQGCAEAGLCYPPTTKVIYLNATGDSQQLKSEVGTSDPQQATSAQFTLLEQLLSDQSTLIKLGVLLLAGIGLAFTPCVYPMYPIISSIVLGKDRKQVSLSNAFVLSLVYVQGMAIMYSVLGLIVASAGAQFQAALQHPVLLSIFIVLFVLLALAMFGVYEIQLPSKWQEKLNALSNTQKRGNLVGVFIMGVLSGLIASPCTTAPLTAVLLLVAQSDSLVFGFTALYTLSIGMGIPLILFAMTGGKILPKAGNWMNVVKVVFGFMMLSVAILFIERFIIADWTSLLWAVLLIAAFGYLFTVNQETKLSFGKGVRSTIIVIGFVYAGLFSIQSLQKNNILTSALPSIGTSA